MHFPYIFYVVMCAVNYLYWCVAKYIHAGLKAQFFRKLPLGTFPYKNNIHCHLKQILKKKLTDGKIFHNPALHEVFRETNDTFATLSFANLVCSLPCWWKDCSNGQESENEETLISRSRNDY